jgi:Ca2+/Na+ antiporter
MFLQGSYSYYKRLATLMPIIGVLCITLANFGPGFIRHPFISGFGSGLLGVALVLGIVMFVKRNDPDFRDDLEAAKHDERIILEQYKMRARLGLILLFSLCVMISISAFVEIKFMVGGTIILWIYIFSAIGMKIYHKLK